MFKKNIVTILLSVLFFVACKNYDTQIDTQKRSLLRAHDELMAKMDSLYQLKKQIIELKNTNTKLSVAEKSYMDSTAFALTRADDAMTNWMAQWKDPDDNGMKDQAALDYLATQQKIVDKMKIQFANSLRDAKQILSK